MQSTVDSSPQAGKRSLKDFGQGVIGRAIHCGLGHSGVLRRGKISDPRRHRVPDRGARESLSTLTLKVPYGTKSQDWKWNERRKERMKWTSMVRIELMEIAPRGAEQ